jgi:lysophospholipase L1-like esterase
LTRSETVVIGVGGNDLKYRRPDQIARDYGALLDRLAGRPTVVVLAVLPIDEAGEAARSRSYLRNKPIGVLNQLLGSECEKHVNCRVLDAWPILTAAHGPTPRADLYDSDGWHLSEEGSNLLAAAIRRSLQPP